MGVETRMNNVSLREVEYFDLGTKEPYARRVKLHCWYFNTNDKLQVVQVHKCLKGVRGRSLLEVTRYTVTTNVVHEHYPVLSKNRARNTVYIDAEDIVRPAHVWHKCVQKCDTQFSQCRRTDGTFVLNPFYLK